MRRDRVKLIAATATAVIALLMFSQAAPTLPDKESVKLPPAGGANPSDSRSTSPTPPSSDQPSEEAPPAGSLVVVDGEVRHYVGPQLTATYSNGVLRHATGAAVRLAGADCSATPVATELTATRFHYMSSAGVSSHQAASEVVVPAVWPGIDLVLLPGLKYEFHISAGACPSAVQLEPLSCVASLEDGGRTIVLSNARGNVTDGPLESWSGQGETVSTRWETSTQSTIVGLEVEGWSGLSPLVVDPLVALTYFGGTSADYGRDVAIGADGSNYLCGSTSSADLPVTGGANDTEYDIAATDAFVAKFSADLTSLTWCTFWGGDGDDQATAVDVDPDTGTVVATGYTKSSDALVTATAIQTTLNGTQDAFMLMLSADGSWANYSTYYGGSGNDAGTDVQINASLSAWFTGWTASSWLQTSPDAMNSTSNGAQDAFLAVLNQDCSLEYATFFGGAGTEDETKLDLDSSNVAYLTGTTYSGASVTTTSNALNASNLGGNDLYVAVVDTKQGAAALLYSTHYGGSGDDEAGGISVGDGGLIYIAGATKSTDLPVRSANQSSLAATWDAFAACINDSADGDAQLVYSTFMGGASDDFTRDCDVGAGGYLVFAGETWSNDLNTTHDANQTAYNTNIDGFVCALSPDGSWIEHLTYCGGDGADYLRGTDLLHWRVRYGGYTYSTDLPVTAGAVNSSLTGANSAWMATLELDTTAPEVANHSASTEVLSGATWELAVNVTDGLRFQGGIANATVVGLPGGNQSLSDSGDNVWTLSWEATTAGTYTIEVWACDHAGNEAGNSSLMSLSITLPAAPEPGEDTPGVEYSPDGGEKQLTAKYPRPEDVPWEDTWEPVGFLERHGWYAAFFLIATAAAVGPMLLVAWRWGWKASMKALIPGAALMAVAGILWLGWRWPLQMLAYQIELSFYDTWGTRLTPTDFSKM